MAVAPIVHVRAPERRTVRGTLAAVVEEHIADEERANMEYRDGRVGEPADEEEAAVQVPGRQVVGVMVGVVPVLHAADTLGEFLEETRQDCSEFHCFSTGEMSC